MNGRLGDFQRNSSGKRMSSSGSGFFSFIAVVALGMAGTVYAIKHRTDLAKIAAIAAERNLRTSADGDGAPGQSRHASTADDTEIRANEAGHFETEAEVNGSRIDVLIDTGATLVALTYDDAERAGMRLKASDFTHEVKTANGVAKIAPVDLSSITIGDITVRNVRGAVTERGKLHKTLLGMSFLSRLSRVEMQSNALVLHQ